MKCHEILGINEKSTLSEIESAYLNKMDILSECRLELTDTAYSLKNEELIKAYNDCIAWCDKSTPEKLRSKLAQSNTNLSRQVRLYDIGFCSACGSECEDECCLDGCGCEGCGTAVDVFLYIGIGIGVISGLIALISKIHESYEQTKAEEARRNREISYNQAVNENRSLEREQSNIKEKLEIEKTELNNLEQQHTEIVSFSKLFEALGSNKTTQIEQIISNQLYTKRQSVSNLQRQEAELRQKIEKNNETIRRGR